MIVLNGVSTTSEHESQMQWEAEDSFIRSMGYFHPVRVFEGEIRGFFTEVPEPSSMAFVISAAAAGLRRRRTC